MSLEQGDGWLHRYAKDNLSVPNHSIINLLTGDHITHPQDILKVHAETWSGNWQANEGKEDEVQKAIAKLFEDASKPPYQKAVPTCPHKESCKNVQKRKHQSAQTSGHSTK